MGKTSIEWATHSLNFYNWDCTKVSPGCKNCYMMTMAERYGKPLIGRPQWRGINAFKELHKLPAGARVFVNDMSDTYHETVPLRWIHAIHNEIAYTRPDVRFMLLTKRAERLAAIAPYLVWPRNLWVGVSIESADYTWRIDYLRRVPAAVRFISFEPLIADVGTVDLSGIHWAIVGGESGGARRPFDYEWARNIRSACQKSNTAFFFKQGSAFKPGQNRELDGQLWEEVPA